MAKSATALAQGDRAPNLFLPDQRDVFISLYDKVKGGPIFLLFIPSLDDPSCAQEVQALLELAPGMLARGAHVFVVSNVPVAALSALAQQHEPAFFLMADTDGKAAASCGVDGQLAGFVLDPNQRVMLTLSPGAESLAAQAETALSAWPQPTHFDAPMHPPVLLIPDVFDRDLCRYLIAQFWARGNEDSGTFRMVDGKMVLQPHYEMKRRRDHHVVDKDLLDKIGDMIRRRVLPEIKRAFQFHVTRVEEFKIVCYEPDPGGYFHMHRDNSTPQTMHRRFAMTLNLNSEDYDGGTLRFPEFGGATYKPGTGEAVIFSCSLLHEATEVTRGRRFALLSFLYDEAGQKQLESYRQKMEAKRLRA